jgi:DNA-directed RNA polymerase specialized sigma subunit
MAALSEEARQQIIELWDAGERNKAEIARQVGVSRPTVNKVLRETGLWEPGSEEEDDSEIYAEDGEDADAYGYEDRETEEETAAGVYGALTGEQEQRVLELYEQEREESLDRVAEELELELEDVRAVVEAGEAQEEQPAAPTRPGMLLAGVLLGAGALYLAATMGLVPQPARRRGQAPGGSPGAGAPGAGPSPGPYGSSPGGPVAGR